MKNHPKDKNLIRSCLINRNDSRMTEAHLHIMLRFTLRIFSASQTVLEIPPMKASVLGEVGIEESEYKGHIYHGSHLNFYWKVWEKHYRPRVVQFLKWGNIE